MLKEVVTLGSLVVVGFNQRFLREPFHLLWSGLKFLYLAFWNRRKFLEEVNVAPPGPVSPAESETGVIPLQDLPSVASETLQSADVAETKVQEDESEAPSQTTPLLRRKIKNDPLLDE